MAKTKFRPLHDRVVVRRVESGGIIIPDTAKEKPQEGEIVAVGPGARDDAGKLQALDVKAGDRVLFGKWSGTEVKIDGEDLLIMKESDIMGVSPKPTFFRLFTWHLALFLNNRLKCRPRPRSSNMAAKEVKFGRSPPASACCAASTPSPTP
jgi:chaperonin GroES